jgi:hypothetical protein
LVEDLDLIRGLLLDMEDHFSSCSHMLAHHGVKLQSLDLARQMLRAVTGEFVGAGGLPDIGASLEDLRAACAQALGTD